MLTSSKINGGINGTIKIPGDKSISHRSIIIPSISNGICEISNLLMSEDVIHTINALRALGVKILTNQDKTIVYGNGLNGLKQSNKPIYLGNSGTSARLLCGLLAAQTFESTISGDASLSKRPMKRITYPLEKMGAKFQSENNKMPIIIKGKSLKPIEYEIPIPSAQVKSGIILAALKTSGQTKIIENNITRDHTEIMLDYFGADIKIQNEINKKIISINGNVELKSKNILVPSDLSSSSFLIVAALINKNSKINIENININPSRDGILRALKLMQADITIYNRREINGEMIADIVAQSSKLKGCVLEADMAKLMIDEYPILAIAASFAETPSIFRGLSELKVKESNRLELIKINLINCGIDCNVSNDDLYINPSNKKLMKNSIIRTDFDHRIAMAFAILGSLVDNNIKILDSESINTSFPKFTELFNKVGGKIIG